MAKIRVLKKNQQHRLLHLGLLLIFMLLISHPVHAFVNIGAVNQGPIINGENRAQAMQLQQQYMINQRVSENINSIERQYSQPTYNRRRR